MNRTIKFRGLRTDGKGFAYGLLRKQRQRDVSQSGNGVAYTGEWEYWIDSHEGEQGSWLVIPESVGQFTGLHDKNGVEIYEGKDSLELHLIGLGRGLVDVVMKDGQWNIYTESQGYAPLVEMLNNSSVELTTHTQDGGQEG